ncbi:phosphonoacetaldehyde hydrolase [Paracraurococcus ruber]|uniref:Phosphonoacetaldehyde hydrolase n=1 Tax=Paracraurococcus ruber TaxID=77675 RepID=A0ABS1D0N7_9PROT|nr:phosphonoacetaldehyde hydrolase [Paracraurococcus ruber]MBK1659842.1 phosphonoacetaldehyde hydrolase [Paracraurococcus ruber]TDG32139.1 phosphonoacetaldehyde hydrolase [Paracraurococcus ruber]
MTDWRSPYAGPVRAVILDWAGTVVDHGSRAPMGAFQRAFAEFGVGISIADARGPMGMAKADHIRAVGRAVNEAWRAQHGRDFDEEDVQRIFAVFEPMNIAAVRDHAALIPGAAAALAALRARGIRIGSTTGYTRPIMAALAPLAEAQGFAPEVTVCAGDLAAGRPAPLQMWQAMAAMGVWPAASVVKVDDTAPGIGEGRAAGTWTVGVALTGNIAGLSAEALAALPAAERAALRARATAELEAAGAHLVVDGIADLPGAVAAVEARLAAGETP